MLASSPSVAPAGAPHSGPTAGAPAARAVSVNLAHFAAAAATRADLGAAVDTVAAVADALRWLGLPAVYTFGRLAFDAGACAGGAVRLFSGAVALTRGDAAAAEAAVAGFDAVDEPSLPRVVVLPRGGRLAVLAVGPAGSALAVLPPLTLAGWAGSPAGPEQLAAALELAASAAGIDPPL